MISIHPVPLTIALQVYLLSYLTVLYDYIFYLVLCIVLCPESGNAFGLG